MFRLSVMLILLLAAQAMPAVAGSVWVTCEFMREGTLEADSFGRYEDGMAEFIRHEVQTELMWMQFGGVYHFFDHNDFPERWVMSFSPENMEALAHSDGLVVVSDSCHYGAE